MYHMITANSVETNKRAGSFRLVGKAVNNMRTYTIAVHTVNTINEYLKFSISKEDLAKGVK